MVKRPQIDHYAQQIKRSDKYDLVLAYASEQAPLDNLPPRPKELIQVGMEHLSSDGLFLIYGNTDILPYYAIEAEANTMGEHDFIFKYFIAVRTKPVHPPKGLIKNFKGLLLYGSKNRFSLNKVRIPHAYCSFCGQNVRDWGGKKHLMHPEGTALSDVWKDMSVSVEDELPYDVLDRVVKMSPENNPTVLLMRLPHEGPPIPDYCTIPKRTKCPEVNKVEKADCIEYMQKLPDGCVDLAFADPPYNLDKAYTNYEDSRHDEVYLDWCEEWLYEYQRILKPGGSLFVVNLPKWSVKHKVFLDKYLIFQDWIAWDALSEPRGRLMPAHYSILHYTKDNDYYYNERQAKQMSSDYCFRASCIRKRYENSINDFEPLSNVWWDVPRIKHKKFRDLHPCQLPDKLMERLINIYSRPGNLVFDAFCGAGTTAIAAKKLGRDYLTIDIDRLYVELTKDKLRMIDDFGSIKREVKNNKKQQSFTKKELQLELLRIAQQLGHLPSDDEVIQHSKYELSTFLEVFPTFGKALKAAKIYQEQLSTSSPSPKRVAD